MRHQEDVTRMSPNMCVMSPNVCVCVNFMKCVPEVLISTEYKWNRFKKFDNVPCAWIGPTPCEII